MAAPARWRHDCECCTVGASSSGQLGQVAHEVHAALGSILAGAVAAGSTAVQCWAACRAVLGGGAVAMSWG